MQCVSFPPVFVSDAQILILGSMPGKKSLDEQRYYAHPRNIFWPLVAQILDQPLPQAYQAKMEMLLLNRIALWDVLGRCERPGSLDSSIVAESEQANDFAMLFKKLPYLRRICFNGKKAEAAFSRHVVKKVEIPDLEFISLPSTSPANASVTYAQKFEAWRAAMHLNQTCV